jgi:hypothetical protein
MPWMSKTKTGTLLQHAMLHIRSLLMHGAVVGADGEEYCSRGFLLHLRHGHLFR